jgi:hypothetical protein
LHAIDIPLSAPQLPFQGIQPADAGMIASPELGSVWFQRRKSSQNGSTKPHGLVRDLDPAFVQQVLDVAQ